MSRAGLSPAITAALAAALLFGASTPLAKQLLRDTSPLLLAGLLYLGSGIGLSVGRLLRDRGWRAPGLRRAEWVWLLSAIAFGGVLAPMLLMLGLVRTPAASASLLLNLEAVLTALLAWIVFRENTDRRVVLGMALIVAGAAVLAGRGPSYAPGSAGGALLIALACLCWALDNNLTRKVSASDAAFLAGLKGLAAGVVNTGLAIFLGARIPGPAGDRCGDGDRPLRLRCQPGAVRAGFAGSGRGTHRRLLLHRTLHGRGNRRSCLWRAALAHHLDGGCPDGSRGMATSAGAAPARAYASRPSGTRTAIGTMSTINTHTISIWTAVRHIRTSMRMRVLTHSHPHYPDIHHDHGHE